MRYLAFALVAGGFALASSVANAGGNCSGAFQSATSGEHIVASASGPPASTPIILPAPKTGS